MLCDECNRGFHTYCVGLEDLPAGGYVCENSLCQLEDATTGVPMHSTLDEFYYSMGDAVPRLALNGADGDHKLKVSSYFKRSKQLVICSPKCAKVCPDLNLSRLIVFWGRKEPQKLTIHFNSIEAFNLCISHVPHVLLCSGLVHKSDPR